MFSFFMGMILDRLEIQNYLFCLGWTPTWIYLNPSSSRTIIAIVTRIVRHSLVCGTHDIQEQEQLLALRSRRGPISKISAWPENDPFRPIEGIWLCLANLRRNVQCWQGSQGQIQIQNQINTYEDFAVRSAESILGLYFRRPEFGETCSGFA